MQIINTEEFFVIAVYEKSVPDSDSTITDVCVTGPFDSPRDAYEWLVAWDTDEVFDMYVVQGTNLEDELDSHGVEFEEGGVVCVNLPYEGGSENLVLPVM